MFRALAKLACGQTDTATDASAECRHLLTGEAITQVRDVQVILIPERQTP